MKVGTDFDATISLPSYLFGFRLNVNVVWPRPGWFFFLQPWLIFAKPNWAMVNELRRRKKNRDEIIIITTRPEYARGLTERWLDKNNVCFDQLHCVGSNKEKLSLIQKEGIVIFYDDNPRIRRFLKQRGVEAKPPLTKGQQ